MDGKNHLCNFCKKPCAEAKFLPCSHVFCKACLKFQIISVPTNRQWEGFSCPRCHTYTKAINSDEPLAQWADQFPDSRKKRRSTVPNISPEDTPVEGSPAIRDRSMSSIDPIPASITEPFSHPPTSSSSAASATTPSSPGPVSPVFSDPSSPSARNTSLSSEPNTPDTPNKSDSHFHIPDTPSTPPSSSVISKETSPSKTDLETVTPSAENDNEQNTCMIHPWKHLLVKCNRCNSEACGQCLSESHPTCKGSDFYPLSNTSLLPNMSELESEVQKVHSVSDLMVSSAQQLQQTRDVLRQKIQQMALQIIQTIKKEENQMVQNVQQVYHNEILRLKSGISPAETLLKEVHEVKDKADELHKEPSAVVLMQADSLLDREHVLLERLKAVDFTCIPPDMNFEKNYGILKNSFGDLVVDHGFYPKHDIPDLPLVQSAVESLTVTNEAASNDTPPKNNITPTQENPGPQAKSKSKTLMGRLFSPMQKGKSKFYVKVNEEQK